MQCHLLPAAPAVKDISICKRARASHGGRRARIQNINIGKCAAIQPSDHTLLCPGRIFLGRPVGMQRGGAGFFEWIDQSSRSHVGNLATPVVQKGSTFIPLLFATFSLLPL